MAQVQCPNCSGYKTFNRGKKTELKQVGPERKVGCITQIFYGLLGFLVMASIVGWPFMRALNDKYMRLKGYERITISSAYACEICGYEWER